MNVLVTGGAGYIGSHAVLQLIEAGHRVIVLDDLSTGFASAVAPGALFVEGDAADGALLAKLFARHRIEAVAHFAASTRVDESTREPLRYYDRNTVTSQRLLDACVRAGVRRFLFSSTAAVYGEGIAGAVDETSPTEPGNPYGRSKLMTEWMLQDLAAAKAMTFVALRYFNVAGARVDGTLGQLSRTGHLIKVACEAALGKRARMEIFGTDYPTVDGTGVRDYIHIDDLARAHVDALAYLGTDGPSQTLNCGYGRGFSVLEVISMVKRLAGTDFEVIRSPRRPGDSATVVAVADRIGQVLKWKPRHADLEIICRTALDWERRVESLRGAREAA